METFYSVFGYYPPIKGSMAIKKFSFAGNL